MFYFILLSFYKVLPGGKILRNEFKTLKVKEIKLAWG